MNASLQRLQKQHYDLITASQEIPETFTAVREAIYNAIDAHATSIKLFVSFAEASFCVVDDGLGIPPDYLHEHIGESYVSSESFLHEFSGSEKVRRRSYGKRGKFIASLVALSDVVIDSRTSNAWATYRKEFKRNSVLSSAYATKCARALPGTTVFIRNLFDRLPVRAKLLRENAKHQKGCYHRIRDLFSKLCMIWPEISFDFVFENDASKRVLYIDKTENYADRLLQNFGPILAKDMQYIKHAEFGFSAYGYFVILASDVSSRKWDFVQGSKRARSYYQQIFVMHHHSTSFQQKTAQYIRRRIAGKCAQSLPIFILHVDACKEAMDVVRGDTNNQFLPTSEEDYEKFLHGLTEIMAVSSGLYETDTMCKDYAKDVVPNALAQCSYSSASELALELSGGASEANTCAVKPPPQEAVPESLRRKFPDAESTATSETNDTHKDSVYYHYVNANSSSCFQSDTGKGYHFSRSILKNVVVIGQVDKKYILIVVKEKLNDIGTFTVMAIDQHAADERVKLEALQAETYRHFKNQVYMERYTHSPTIKIQMNAQEVNVLSTFEKAISDWGFQYHKHDMEPCQWLSRDRFAWCTIEMITSPVVAGCITTITDFQDYIHFLSAQQGQSTDRLFTPPFVTRILNSRACRSAIMFGDYLSRSQCEELVQSLSRCELPFQCAHGRPSIFPMITCEDE